MKTRNTWKWMLLAMVLLSGCRILLGPNKINLRWLPSPQRTTVEGVEAWESSTKFESYFEEIRIRGLEKNTTYCFWLSVPPGSGKRFGDIEENRDDSLKYRSLELTLFDKNHKELKYNCGYSSYWTAGWDTLALLRLRTEENLLFDTLYLRISAQGNEMNQCPPFIVHVTKYKTPNLMKLYDDTKGFAMGALRASAVAPVFAAGYTYKVVTDPPRCVNSCICDSLVESKGDVKNIFGGIVDTIIGAEYESGSGFPVRLYYAPNVAAPVPDRLECMLHNFRAFWFKPRETGVYMISAKEKVAAGDMPSGLDSIGLSVFSDESFKIPDSISKDSLKHIIADRLMKVCEDIIVGIRMAGSGKYLQQRPDSIVIGASADSYQGLLLGRDSTYYILVSGPMFKPFECILNIRKQSSKCLGTFPSSGGPNIYDFQHPLVQSTCNPYTRAASPDVATIQNWLPAFKSESQWTDYCWYDIQGTDAEALDFEVASEFEGKLAIYTYGDAGDYSTYNLVKQQLFGFSTQPPTLKFTLSPVPHKRNMRMLIAHNEGEGGTIHINMTERISLFSLED